MEKRTCKKCGEEKADGDFYRRRLAHGFGYTGECKACRSSRAHAHYRANKTMHAASTRARYETFGRFNRYGITEDQYRDLLAASGGCCALCRTDRPGGKGTWHIDHVGGTIRNRRHQCDASKVRGILCHRCNVSLGHYEKLVERLGSEVISRYLISSKGI